MRTLDQIRRSHASARPKHDNPAWLHTHNDLTFVLESLDASRAAMAHDCIAAIETARPLCDRDSHQRSADYNQGLADGIARGLKIAVRAVRLVAEEKRCEACSGSGEVVKGSASGDPQDEYSIACPECGGSGRV